MKVRACSKHWKHMNMKMLEKPKRREVVLDEGINYRKIG
jgi:hypothetical protein